MERRTKGARVERRSSDGPRAAKEGKNSREED